MMVKERDGEGVGGACACIRHRPGPWAARWHGPAGSPELSRPRGAGIQRIRLRDYGVQLRPGAIYQWSVALVPDPSRRSHDLVALGYVERVSASSVGAGDARAQAEAGLWYDTIETLSDQSSAGPKREWASRKRDQLFRQVGLDAAVP